MKNEEKIIDTCWKILDNSDDTGCSGDLTVTSKSAIEELRRLLENDILENMQGQREATKKAFDSMK